MNFDFFFTSETFNQASVHFTRETYFNFTEELLLRCKLSLNRRFVFRPCVIHCWRTFYVLMFRWKEIVKMLHLCQKIQRFLQIIKCVKNLKIRNFLQNDECVFTNMFWLVIDILLKKNCFVEVFCNQVKVSFIIFQKIWDKDLMLKIMLRFFDVDVSVVHLSVALPTFVKSVKPIKSNLRFFNYFFVLKFSI